MCSIKVAPCSWFAAFMNVRSHFNRSCDCCYREGNCFNFYVFVGEGEGDIIITSTIISTTTTAITTTTTATSWPGSSVGTATDYGLDGPGSNPGGDEIFCSSRPALGPTHLPINGYQFFPGGKLRPGRAADHSSPSSAAVMEE